ncbi:MAG: subclass B3 metallo-beta-lactamase [Chitinophagaceae bacterium]
MHYLKKLVIALACFAFAFTNENTLAQKVKEPYVQEIWKRDYEPFRIAGNLYYVGTYDLACYLITTPAGHILINTGVASSAAMIRKHVEKLGFHFSNIKILLATHSHYDHVGAMAAIKKMTGAKMMINEKDVQLLADGGNSDFIMGGKGSTFEPVKADRILHDIDTVRLGGSSIVVLHHPGHTKGACSFLFDVKDDHRSYRVLIANMPTILSETKLSGMPTYPDVGKDYAYTLNAMKKINFDIWLCSHASQFDLQKKHTPGSPYRPEEFFDQKGYDDAMKDLQKEYDKRLNEK